LHASLFFLALAWVLPFLQWHHQPPIPSFFSEWLAFGLGLFAALPLLSKRYWQPMALPRSLLFLIGLIGILIVQVVLDRIPFPQQAFVAALYILWGALMLWLGNQLARELGLDGIARVLSWALLIGALASCIIGVLQHFGIHSALDPIVNKKVTLSVTANLGQPNHLADYLALGLASLLYLLGTNKIKPWAALLAGVLLLSILALTGSRSGWLYLGALVVWAGIGRKRSADAATRRIFIAALLMLPIFWAAQWLTHLSWVQSLGGAAVTPNERLFDLANGVDVRLYLWREAAQMWVAHPFFGVGFGQFAWQQFQLGSAAAVVQSATTLTPSFLAGNLYNHSHNLFAQIGAEFGGAGLLLVIVGGGLWFWGCARRPITLAGWWTAAILTVLFIHSLVEYPLWYSNFLGIAAILIGATDTHTLRLRMSGLMRSAFGVMLLLSAISLVRIVDNYNQLEGLLHNRQAMPSVQEIDRVLQQVRHESLLAPYSDFAYALSIILNREAIDDKVLWNEEVMQFAPTQEMVYRHATLLSLQGDNVAAQAMLKRALVTYPDGAENFLNVLSRLELDSRRRVEPLREIAQIFLQEQKKHAVH
jgi:O-antigen ligase